MTSSCAFSQIPQESICLVPEIFTGAIFIVYDQKDGVDPTLEGNRHVYKIPQDGILRTTVKVNFRIENNEFFFIDAKGERRKIEYLYPGGSAWSDKEYTFDKIDQTKGEVYVFSDLMGGVAVNGKDVRFRQFLIGKAQDKEKLSLEADKKAAKATGAPDVWNSLPK